MICKHCGANLLPEEKVCSYCRCQVEEVPPPSQNMSIQNVPQQFPAYTPSHTIGKVIPRHKKPALILCLLGFFGFGGLHRFYSGKFWTGLLWFLTGGMFYIGTIIDLVNIIMNTFYDKDGNPLQK